MKLTRYITIYCLILAISLLTHTVRSQEAETKSGTVIRPADRMPAMFPNPSKQSPTLTDPTAGTYLVVTHPDWLEPLQPLLRWKRQQGYRVELLCTTTNLRDSIRARLIERYESATAILPAQQYVLLVGDVNRIQAFAGKYTPSGLTNRVTDLYYGEYTGDYLPECYVGRLSVADSAELAAVVAKIVAYEQGQWATAARRLLFAAGRENRDPAPTTTNGQVNYLGERAAACLPETDTVCFRNPVSAEQTDSLLQALSQSNALVNYTAHCTASGWENPYITYNAIDTLGNPVPTLFVNNCCLSNAYDGTCFGERLLRRPSGGAVGVLGATNETLWNEDFYWAVGAKCPPTLLPEYDSLRPGAFDGIFCSDGADLSLGAMLQAGCQAVSMAGSPYDAYYWETYCLLGDPSMVPFLGRDDSLGWMLPDSLLAGSTQLHVVGSPFTRISATQDTLLLGTALSGADGTCLLTLGRALAEDSLTLTGTRPGAIPLVATLPVMSPSQGRLAATQYVLDDSVLIVTIKNVGLETVQQHYIHLSQDSNDRMSGATFDMVPPVAVASLASQADTVIVVALGRLVIGNEPLLSALLVTTDSLGVPYDTLRMIMPTADMRPKVVRIAVLDTSGSRVKKVLPNEHYLLETAISHPSDSVVFRYLGVPEGSELSELSEISDSNLYFPFVVEEGTNHLHIELTAHKDRWQHDYDGWLVAGDTWERFETGDFGNLPWRHNSLYPWQIDSNMAHGGHYCVRSATIGDAQKSVLELDIETLADDSVSFWYRVSSEAHDWLYFFLDGRRVGYWSGNSGWQRYARLMSAGRHKLQWVYQKDASHTEREDCAYIDDLRLPLAVWRQPYGMSEQDTHIIAIHSLYEKGTIKVYPNPTLGSVTIELNSSPQARHIELFDTYGRRVDEIFIPPNCNLTQYFTTLLRCGVYSMVLHDTTGIHIQKLIVKK